MTQKLYIISAGSFGRELYYLARGFSPRHHQHGFEPIIFLDDREDILQGKHLNGARIQEPVESHQPESSAAYLCAIGDPKIREHYAALITDRGGKFATIVSEKANCNPDNTHLKQGVIISPFCVISCDVQLGPHTFVSSHTTISHDVQSGNCCQIGSHVVIGGKAMIGNRVTIHPHATILPGINIADDATIGAGSVVIRDVHQGETVFGIPAMTVKH
ncbi:hypothetical protein BOW53_00390 [Solemya pervernicosa gill symbiont]|uniref:PglD N-terminal domain-containing protein n=1 Tax=Solemya pervernicosa gill symbiont TaxID=642797 RepID=A0A1T2LB55_9GAMM|nr:NeuD/PglB/VioB family sugar acetyltransferase [Solemya pervernicosa gill symbiont]OOZ42333.1 hypothetical protein BOW53_00390 [Solemya pervernicosa gill symbiont]